MNGWWRLGIVLTSPIALIAAVIGYENGERSTLYSAIPSETTEQLEGQAKIDAIWAEFRHSEKLRDCELSTVQITQNTYGLSHTITCENLTKAKVNSGLAYGAVPFMILGLFGLAISWIYRGFRPAV